MKAQAIQATTADGLTLRGEIVRGSTTWVAFVHDVGEDIDVWRGLRRSLGARQWTIVAFDLRGHGGSDGERWMPDRAELDVDLAITLARRAGAEHVAVVASGRSGITTLHAIQRALSNEAFELPDSLVLLSPGPLEGLDPANLRGNGVAKLILYGALDPQAADVEAIQRASIGWTVATSFPTQARASDLLDEWPAHIHDKTRSFISEQRTLRGVGLQRAAARVRSPR